MWLIAVTGLGTATSTHKFRALSVSRDDVIKCKHVPRYLPFLWGIHRSPVNYPHKGEWRGALMFSLICAWINGCVNNGEAGDLRRHRALYDVTVVVHEMSAILSRPQCVNIYGFIRTLPSYFTGTEAIIRFPIANKATDMGKCFV